MQREQTLILGALEEEIADLRAAMTNVREQTVGAFTAICGELEGQEILLCRCGIGKTNAAAVAATMLTAFPSVTRAINTGVAGGIDGRVRRGDVVLGERTVQYDFDQTADGQPLGLVPDFDSPYFAGDAALLHKLQQAFAEEKVPYTCGTIATGDRFVADPIQAKYIADTFGATACEMESASIAVVCALFSVPFVAVRAISDDGGDGAIESFYEFVQRAAANNARGIRRFLRDENWVDRPTK